MLAHIYTQFGEDGIINRHVPADQMEDFFKDFPKYCGGALLGYLGEEVRGNPVSIFRT
jgi:hypothetical protein